MNKTVVHNIVTLFTMSFVKIVTIHNSLIVTFCRKATILFIMSLIAVNFCHLFTFHSNFMSKADGTALLKTKTSRILITLKHHMWSMEATMRCLFSASTGIHCRGRKSSFPETAKLDQVPWVDNDQMGIISGQLWSAIWIFTVNWVTSLQVKARTDFVYKQLAGQVYGGCTIQLPNSQSNCTAFSPSTLTELVTLVTHISLLIIQEFRVYE